MSDYSSAYGPRSYSATSSRSSKKDEKEALEQYGIDPSQYGGKRRKSRRRKRRKSRRKSRKRRRRGGLIPPPEEESFEKAYVSKEYGGSPTCYGPRDCTSDKAKRDKRMCLSYGYNRDTGQSDCQWGVPPAPKPVMAPVMAPAPKPVAPVMAPTYKTDDRCRNLKGKVSARCGIRHSKAECEKKEKRRPGDTNKKKWKPFCKWTGDVMAPMVCEDDMTFIRQGPGSSGKPLCEVIKSRKQKMAMETDQTKRAEMLKVIMKNCNQLGATYCKKTCGKCPKKKGGKKGGRKYTKKNFKKHYMWNTRGKRYFAKTYKQHRRGVKLGHTHKKPKKTRKRRR